jgi:hypothetical protein
LGRTLPGVPGIPIKLGRTLRRVRRLQLINIRLIPNTALLLFFLLCCVMCVALCRCEHGVPKRLVVFGGRRDHLAAMLRGEALSVGLAV